MCAKDNTFIVVVKWENYFIFQNKFNSSMYMKKTKHVNSIKSSREF